MKKFNIIARNEFTDSDDKKIKSFAIFMFNRKIWVTPGQFDAELVKLDTKTVNLKEPIMDNFQAKMKAKNGGTLLTLVPRVEADFFTEI